jgi:transcription elongation factor Elf1
MGTVSKNSRTTVATHKFTCSSCGGDVVMKTLFEKGKLKNIAECSKCKRVERRPKDFK